MHICVYTLQQVEKGENELNNDESDEKVCRKLLSIVTDTFFDYI